MPRNFIAFLFGNAVKGKEVKSKNQRRGEKFFAAPVLYLLRSLKF